MVLILASLTVGSINPGNSTGRKDPTDFPGFYTDHVMVYSANGIVPFAGTTVTLDMTDGQPTPDDFTIFALGHHGPMKTGSFEFIKGKMIVQQPGQDNRSYPVHWVRATLPRLENGMIMASFVADMDVPMGVAQGQTTAAAVASDMLQFHSVLNMSNPIVSSPTTTVTLASDDNNTVYDNQIMQGQTEYHEQTIASGSTTMSVDLKWKNANDSLRLMIYSPDGHTLGPYYDSSDNQTNGEINLNISNTQGIAAGTWSFKVTGADVTGSEGYYIRAW